MESMYDTYYKLKSKIGIYNPNTKNKFILNCLELIRI